MNGPRAGEDATDRPQRWTLIVASAGLAGAAVLFAWFVDQSVPLGGSGWADQNLYTKVARTLGGFGLPRPNEFHYQMGYPILGAVGSWLVPSQPFLVPSVLLASVSAGLVADAGRRVLGARWTLLLVILTYVVGDGRARSFAFGADVFAVPWNNQVGVALFAFYFWVAVARTGPRWTSRFCIVFGLVGGFSVATREELALFVIPTTVGFLYRQRAERRQVLLVAAALFVGYLPHLLIKVGALGSLTETGRSDDASYLTQMSRYFDVRRLATNVVDVVVDSEFRGVEGVAGRKALLQAQPWLWAAPLGLWWLLRADEEVTLKAFVLLSIALLLFYLAGNNVSVLKLKFHALRYVMPSLLGLQLLAVYAARRVVAWAAAAMREGPAGAGGAVAQNR